MTEQLQKLGWVERKQRKPAIIMAGGGQIVWWRYRFSKRVFESTRENFLRKFEQENYEPQTVETNTFDWG